MHVLSPLQPEIRRCTDSRTAMAMKLDSVSRFPSPFLSSYLHDCVYVDDERDQGQSGSEAGEFFLSFLFFAVSASSCTHTRFFSLLLSLFCSCILWYSGNVLFIGFPIYVLCIALYCRSLSVMLILGLVIAFHTAVARYHHDVSRIILETSNE